MSNTNTAATFDDSGAPRGYKFNGSKDITPSTFDEQLRKMLYNLQTPDAANAYNSEQEYIDDLKQLVAREVIGKPINVYGRSNLYASKPGTEGLEQKWYDLGTNGRIEEQMKALGIETNSSLGHEGIEEKR